METPNYIKSLLMPNGRKPAGRRVWSIDLELIWLPFLTATNVMGDTRIPHEALGAPLRLGYDADGSVKFSKSGRPILKVAKDLSDTIRMVRENFTAGLLSYASGVIAKRGNDYKQMVELATKAGQPIVTRDKENLEQAFVLQMEKAVASATEQEQAPPIPVEKVAIPA